MKADVFPTVIIFTFGLGAGCLVGYGIGDKAATKKPCDSHYTEGAGWMQPSPTRPLLKTTAVKTTHDLK